MEYDFLVVGAGFSGSACAERLASSGHKVLIIDRRPHIGGNAFDGYDAHGVRIHYYGPHIFHTNSDKVFEYLSGFTTWRFYEHRVRAMVDGAPLPFPINRTTLKYLTGLDVDEQGMADYLERVRVPCENIVTSEDVVLSSVGHELCDTFYRTYTLKQWGLDLSQLSAGVASRVPVRTNDDDRYFTDKHNYMPEEGYGVMFQRMLDHPNIDIRLSTDYFVAREGIKAHHTIYTGPIDSFFNHCFGQLPYRSLVFEHKHLQDIRKLLSTGVYNYPSSKHPYTRITEFKHLTGQEHSGTSIVIESSSATGDPYYPIPRPENDKLYSQYAELAEDRRDVSFVGRLARYRYINMDQAVLEAINLSEDLVR